MLNADEPMSHNTTWELVLSPEDADRLSRLKLLAPLREGRARNRAVRIVWHDGPEAELAKTGLALVERKGLWLLEQMRPGSAKNRRQAWFPGRPSPILAQAATQAGLMEGLADPESSGPAEPALPAACIPWAAFEGREIGYVLRIDSEVVDLTFLNGAIRTVMREQPACRLLISGRGPLAASLAGQIAGELKLAIPRFSLAEEALAIARGAEPKPRALGAPVLVHETSVAEAFDHIVAHLTDVILYWAPLAAAGKHGPEPVHQIRVATRRLRSAFSVFSRAIASPSVAEVDAGLKKLAATLGPARDWDVFNAGIGANVGQAFDADQQEGRAVAKLLAATERQRVAGYEALQRLVATAEFRQLGIRLAALAATRPWQTEIDETAQAALEMPLTDFAASVLGRRLKRMFSNGDDIEHLETETLHEIRLKAKRLRYAAEFFSGLFPSKSTKRFIGRLSVLQECLGTLNDGAVAAGLLNSLPGAGSDRAFAIGAIRGFVAATGGASRAEIAQAWAKFRKQDPFWT
jgi:triphosphatase